MVSNDQNSYYVTGNAKEKVVRKAVEVGAANVSLPNREPLGPLCGVENKSP
jgi:hypothetical protein